MKRHAASFAISVSFLLLVVGGRAFAQTAETPAIQVGDQWHFVQYWGIPSAEPNRVWTIRSVTAAGIDATENEQALVLTPELGVVDSPRTSESNPRLLSFPLALGKRWTYTTDWVFKAKGSKGSADIHAAVVAHEKVKVHAGEFDAFKLVAKAAMRGVSGIGSQIDAEGETTYWYAPSARAIVKSVNRNPYLGTSTVELVQFTLQGK